jgi:HEAT repeat protein
MPETKPMLMKSVTLLLALLPSIAAAQGNPDRQMRRARELELHRQTLELNRVHRELAEAGRRLHEREQLERLRSRELLHGRTPETLRQQELHLRELQEAARAPTPDLLHERMLRLRELERRSAGEALRHHPLVPESYAPQDPADSVYRTARSLFNRNQYRDAARVFRRIRSEPRFNGSAYRPGAFYWEAYSLSQTGSTSDLRQARELLAELRDEYPEDRQVRDAAALDATIAARLARGGDASAARDLRQRATSDLAQCPAEQDDVRMIALNALLQMDAGTVVPALREIMARTDACSAPLRRQAIFMLSQRRAPGVDEILLQALNDPDPEVREAAVFWLSRVDSPQAVTALEQILRTTTDREVQEKALFALAQNPSPRAAEVLRDFIARGDVPAELRSNAIVQLGVRHDTDNAAFLRDIYNRTEDREVREHILHSVGETRDPATTEWLLDIAMNESESRDVRQMALFRAMQGGHVRADRIAPLYDRAPDREFKQSLLHMLGQMLDQPAALDKLMEIARNEQDPELSRMAIFWVSQSRDPRVAQLLLEIIKR